MNPWRVGWRDLGYAVVGLTLCWFVTGNSNALGIWALCLLAYCAGRAVGASHR